MEGKFDFSTPITEDTTLNALWTCSDIDPNNPTLQNLKLALGTGNPSAIYPIGTLCPDVYTVSSSSTTNFNWRVMHYGTATSATGQEITGAYLMADVAIGASPFGNPPRWGTCSARAAIQNGGGYYSRISADAKGLVTVIKNKFQAAIDSSASTPLTTQVSTDEFFIPSLSQVGGGTVDSGVWWDWFKQQLGGVVTTDATPSRVVGDGVTARDWWLRDAQNPYSVRRITTTGVVGGGTPDISSYYVVPCFFMAS